VCVYPKIRHTRIGAFRFQQSRLTTLRQVPVRSPRSSHASCTARQGRGDPGPNPARPRSRRNIVVFFEIGSRNAYPTPQSSNCIVHPHSRLWYYIKSNVDEIAIRLVCYYFFERRDRQMFVTVSLTLCKCRENKIKNIALKKSIRISCECEFYIIWNYL